MHHQEGGGVQPRRVGLRMQAQQHLGQHGGIEAIVLEIEILQPAIRLRARPDVADHRFRAVELVIDIQQGAEDAFQVGFRFTLPSSAAIRRRQLAL